MLDTQEAEFRFGDVEVREREFSIIKAGRVVPVEPKAFRVLLFLLHNPQKLTTKEELLDAVWGETAVSENSLARSIALLRRLLEDDPHQPRYIETVSTVGYRFICPVESHSGETTASIPGTAGSTDAKAPEPQIKERHPRNILWLALAAAGALLAGAAGFTWYALRPLPMPRITSFRLIASVGQWGGIAGTDGSSIYLDLFLPNGNGVVPVSGGRVVPLSFDLPTSKDSPADSSVIGRVSPDGSKLLVGGDLDPSTGRQLWVVDAHGGGARYLAQGYALNWSPDGRTVVYATLNGDMYTIPAEGGESRLLLASPTPFGATSTVSSIVWSPDGSRIRYVRNARYWEISANGEYPHEILPNWHAANPRYFMAGGKWTPDGDFFVFLGGVAGFAQDLGAARQLWILDERESWPHRANPEPARLTNVTTIWGEFAFSRDGKELYSIGMSPRGELERYDVKSKQLVPYLGGISAEYVSFSRDGKYLIYVAYPDGTMWRANRDGSGIQQLTGPPFHPIAPEWSPDGAQILFSEVGASHRGDLYLISSQGGAPRRLLPGDKGWARIPSWSPDGKRVVFDQNPVGTLVVATAIWVWQGEKSRILDLDTGKLVDLPPCPKPCVSPRWSPDGRYILELAVDHKTLMVLDLETNEWSQLNPGLSAMSFPRWSHDGGSIFVQDSDIAGVVRSAAPGIYRIPVARGKAERVVDLRGFRGTGSLTVGWSSLDPDDTPLLLRNVGTYDVYALALERK